MVSITHISGALAPLTPRLSEAVTIHGVPVDSDGKRKNKNHNPGSQNQSELGSPAFAKNASGPSDSEQFSLYNPHSGLTEKNENVAPLDVIA